MNNLEKYKHMIENYEHHQNVNICVDDIFEEPKENTYVCPKQQDKVSSFRKQTEYGPRKFIKP